MKRWKSCLLVCAFLLCLTMVLPAQAAKKTMPDGGTFDAEYYAAHNPDVVAAVGTSETALYNHYKNFGAAEGRKPYATPQPYETQLTAGHYIAGKDIPVGTYNITWISGNGNVMGGSIFRGGINEIFGTDSSYAITSYANCTLNQGEVLTIMDDLKVDIASAAADVEGMVPRQQAAGLGTFQLSAGSYLIGQDIPAGTFNITAVSGRSGNVMTDYASWDNGINEIMGLGSEYAIQECHNIVLTAGGHLTVTSSITIQLTPAGE